MFIRGMGLLGGAQLSTMARVCCFIDTHLGSFSLIYPTKSNALASYCTENEGTPSGIQALSEANFYSPLCAVANRCG
jgi:hypothetical protein